MKNIVITIPIYKETPNPFELISFLQSLKILNRYKFSLIIPYGLDVTIYESHLKSFNISYTLEHFDHYYFKDINGYNKLMLSIDFYDRFIEYDYLLIYQLDCYVFSDELEKWCNLNYDYIGAPWVHCENDKLRFIGVGNGGLSLRDPKKLKIYLKSSSLRINIWGYWKLYISYGFLKRISRIPKILLTIVGYKNNKNFFIQEVGLNEDYIFGYISQYSNNKNKLKIPSIKKALQFSIDTYPRMLYKLNNTELPFGCHGWYKLDENIQFWKKFINMKNT